MVVLTLVIIFIGSLWVYLYCLKRVLNIKSEKIISLLIKSFVILLILNFFMLFFTENKLHIFYLWDIKNNFGLILNIIVNTLTAIAGIGFLLRKKQFYFLGLFIFGYSLSVFYVRLGYFIYLILSKKYVLMKTAELVNLGFVSLIVVLIFNFVILFMLKYKKYFISSSEIGEH
ncbi:MAG: hypothetical protein HY796_11660 [Elusimicrobia bacterium]|nr:hypothetical protein [Elusimicrobiota bacterium]